MGRSLVNLKIPDKERLGRAVCSEEMGMWLLVVTQFGIFQCVLEGSWTNTELNWGWRSCRDKGWVGLEGMRPNQPHWSSL